MLSAPRFSRMINRPSPSSRRKATALLLRVFSVVASLLVYGDCAPASFVVEKAAFSILGPDNLKGTFDSAIGDFGVPRYGAKLVGEVVYDAMNSHGCELFVDLPLATGVGHSTVVLIDRGDCFFVEKAWHAQLAGANAVIVADNVDEELLTMANPGSEDGEQAALTSKINIPSALVTKSVGDKIKQAIRDGAKPLVALDWSDSIASPDDHVEWELWSTSNQVCGQMCDRVGAFVNEMHDAAMKLEKEGDASFSPHFITWSCMDSSRPDCKDLCIFGGRYCAPDPTEGTGVDAAIAAKVRGFGYNGSAVTIENLRQLCLFRELNGPHHTAPWLWWTYAVRHRGGGFSYLKLDDDLNMVNNENKNGPI